MSAFRGNSGKDAGMKIAVFGAAGQLGRAVCRALAEQDYAPIIPFTHQRCDISNRSDVALRWGEHRFDAAINCAGVISGSEASMGLANTAGPLVLMEAANRHGFRLIHVSTDCVFGAHNHRSPYTEKDVPVPDDRYGRTKLAGEPLTGNVLTVRTSFIGHEAGLMRWLFDCAEEEKSVEGWQGAWWNGSTVEIVASYLAQLVTESVTGVVHMGSVMRSNKYDMLRIIARAFGLDIEIVPVVEPRIWRVLQPTIVIPPFWDGLAAMGQRMRERS